MEVLVRTTNRVLYPKELMFDWKNNGRVCNGKMESQVIMNRLAGR